MADRQPTMSDVAREAGVSPITVSRVLNNYEFVKSDTREKVLRAVAHTGYRPNLAARALVTRKSHVLGVLVADAFGHGPTAALWAIEDAAGDAGYAVTVVSLRGDDREAILAGLRRLNAQGVDGIVMIAPQHEATSLEILDVEGTPVVTLSAFASEVLQPIMLDSVAGSRAAVRHLAQLGHRTIAHLAGPAGWAAAEARLRGWRDECAALGLHAGPVAYGDWTAGTGHALAPGLLSDGRVTAVYAASDAMAQGALLALHERGLRVPVDVSLVGFDDAPEAEYFIPPLTTVHQDFEALGRRCIASVVELIEGRAAPAFDPLEPTLVVRASTAAPRI
ncbi:LacI family transcriptional regulator [Agromyces rhizosphaerae]|uniref:LacI family transcriptional regulator n=1 Tax=Agromyces rhizosphaerae TaxID=88374 RepID=A0A9W6CW70_9MICO|nr:LacI family DNA-binding transcriptional regulator [Agromyces rhizosphaerae]GLI26362.1 LacI family transcriptional regulator [Agromyces rhizosphaerae]